MKKIILALFLVMISVIPVSEAAIQTIEADGTHIMGDTDSRDTAQKLAIEEAINNAALEAGTYIASYTTVKNFVITEDEIKSITSSIIKVLNQQVTFETPSADKWVCHAHILAEVDTSTLENLVDAYIEKQRNANNHVYTEPNNNTHNNINIGEPYSYPDYTENTTPMPNFPKYQSDTITQVLRGNKHTVLETPPPLSSMPISKIQSIYANGNTATEEASDNNSYAYNIYRITNNPQNDSTYVVYDKTGRNLMGIYTICWNSLRENRLYELQRIFHLNNMSPVASSCQFYRKLYYGRTVNVQTDYISYQSNNDNYKIVAKIENWKEEGFTTIQIRRSNSVYF